LVAGIILAVAALAVGLFIFKSEISNFFATGFESIGSTLTAGAGELSTSVDETFLNPIRKAGEEAGLREAERLRLEQIKSLEAGIEQAAKDQGFDSIEAFNKATDSGSIVIGGERTTIDFGLIGDVFPTNPSPEFIAANPLLFQTRGQTRFGGQR